jgi:hypothetical protein
VEIAQARPPLVEFKQVGRPDAKRSEEAGRRITKDVNLACITQPGSRDTFEISADEWLAKIRRNAIEGTHDAYPQEWVDQFYKKYEMWKAGQEAPVSGTHVKEWPLLSPAQVQNFISLRIITIEDVANLTEEAIQRAGMGTRELRDKAREWLAKRELANNAVQENEALKAQLAALTAQVQELLDAQKKRGRPAKTTE